MHWPLLFFAVVAPSDHAAFQQWFSFLAESQFYLAPASRPKEIIDCAALVRFAYREALRTHDAAWAARIPLPKLPALRPFPARPIDPRFTLPGGQSGHFADARTLLRFNTRLIGRDLSQAQPGDLFFFHQPGQKMPFHVMIYVGPSHFAKESVVVYHTGPASRDPGEIRRLTMKELFAHPEPRWRPHAANPSFLGLYRWNLLAGSPQ